MPHAEVNGQKLFYEDSGSGEPAIVFSHGLFMDHSMFDPQVAALSDRFRCIRWDERGHGQTDSTADAFSYWDSADDVLGLMDHLGVERAVLAGMSQGGFLSLRAALRAPDRVLGLVLLDTQAGTEKPENIPAYDQLNEVWISGNLPQEVADTVAAIILGEGFADTPQWQEKWRAIPHDKVRQVYATLKSRDDLWPRLGEIDTPAIVIHGEQDAAIDVPTAERLARELHAELVLVPGAGHAANLTHPDAVNPAIERFVGAL
jgi:pimeloyl-ACP methyl ester carboxylesterase